MNHKIYLFQLNIIGKIQYAYKTAEEREADIEVYKHKLLDLGLREEEDFSFETAEGEYVADRVIPFNRPPI